MIRMNPTPASQGSITGWSFLGLVSALNRRRATGALRLTQESAEGQIEKALYFERGEIYAAASNARADSVLAILVRAGGLDEARAAEVERQTLAGQDVRQALIDSGGVTAESLAQLRLDHVTAIFDSVGEWESGRYEFVAGARVAGGPLGRDTMSLVCDHARRAQVPEDFRLLAAERRRHIVRAPQESAHIRLTPREEYLLELMQSPLSFEALRLTAALSEGEVWRALYALSCAGLIAFVPVMQSRFEWVPFAAPSENPAAQTTARAVHRVPDESVTTDTTERHEPDAARAEAMNAPDAADSTGDQNTAEVSAAGVSEQAKSDRLQEARQEIRKIKAALAAARDDYEALGLLPGAAPPEVRQAFRRLVGQYHPDRFQQYADAETLAELNGIVTVLRQAYESATEHALLHAALAAARARISTAADGLPPTNGHRAKPGAVAPPPAPGGFGERKPDALEIAAVKYQEAILAEEDGDRAKAIRLFDEAVSLDPRNAAYRARLASLLALNQSQRRQAESHLLRAVDLEPQNVAHRVQLGQLYRSLSLLPQAEQQLRVALKLDPQHQETLGELRELAALKKADPQPSSGARRAAKPVSFFARLFRRSPV
jgi:tetratricopeptide (TPR) repeat protein